MARRFGLAHGLGLTLLLGAAALTPVLSARNGAGWKAGAWLCFAGGERAEERAEALLRPQGAEVLSEWASIFRQHNVTLTDPFFEGRAPGSRGIEFAADYIEFHFRRGGLKPAIPGSGDGEASFRQNFEFGSRTTAGRQSLALTGPSPINFRAGTDFSLIGLSGNGEVKGPLVFVGYSIEDAEDGYSSFPEGTDLTGKVALLLRFEPMNDEGKSRWTETGVWSTYSTLENKIRAAVDRGAAAVLFANPPGADDSRMGKLETVESLPSRRGLRVPVMMVSEEAAERLVRAGDASGRSLLDLRKIADAGASVVDLPGARISLAAELSRGRIETSNVIGLLPGRGALADEYIVLGAHYDHLGYGGAGSRDPGARGQLHPGADDNASGTSGLLLLAQELPKAYREMPKDADLRSILFMAFTAEESGLHGSRHYVANPIAETSKHYIMINMDMIGRLRESPPLEVSGVATAEGLREFVTPYFDSSGLRISARPGGLGPSDHASFFNGGIPVLFFFTGLHQEYHTPRDVSATINNEGAAKVADLVYRMTLDLARRAEPLPFARDSAEARRMERPDGRAMRPAEPGAPAAEPPNDAGVGPVRAGGARLGIIPNMDAYDDAVAASGVLIDGASAGSAAEKAGLLKGDRIIRIGQAAVTSIQDLMGVLARHQPGDTVEIAILREGEERTVTATLQRSQPRNE